MSEVNIITFRTVRRRRQKTTLWCINVLGFVGRRERILPGRALGGMIVTTINQMSTWNEFLT